VDAPVLPLDANEDASTPPVRLTSAATQSVLEQLRGSPLIASGKLCVVAVDAIAERLGPRWPLRRDLLHEHTQKALSLAVGDGLVHRISETQYIVAQPDAPRAAGQLRCIRALREILARFLGEASVGDVRVHQVTRITEDGVFGQALAPAAVEAAGAREEGIDEAPAPASLDAWSPFATSIGHRVAVSGSLEPIVHLKSSRRIGYRLASRVQRQPAFAALTQAEFQRLAPIDLERIDLATIARGLDRLRVIAAQQKPPSLIVPIANVTLQTRQGRANIIDLLRRARAFVAHGLICELTGVEGAPVATIQEAVASLRPFSLHVIARLRPAAGGDARHLKGVGLDGLSARCHAQTRDELMEAVRSFVRANGFMAKTFLLYQLPSVELARAAAEFGITHATLAPHRLRAVRLDDEPY
jgi:hypothetical protein